MSRHNVPEFVLLINMALSSFKKKDLEEDVKEQINEILTTIKILMKKSNNRKQNFKSFAGTKSSFKPPYDEMSENSRSVSANRGIVRSFSQESIGRMSRAIISPLLQHNR
jgi:hypothetical protein